MHCQHVWDVSRRFSSLIIRPFLFGGHFLPQSSARPSVILYLLGKQYVSMSVWVIYRLLQHPTTTFVSLLFATAVHCALTICFPRSPPNPLFRDFRLSFTGSYHAITQHAPHIGFGSIFSNFQVEVSRFTRKINFFFLLPPHYIVHHWLSCLLDTLVTHDYKRYVCKDLNHDQWCHRRSNNKPLENLTVIVRFS